MRYVSKTMQIIVFLLFLIVNLFLLWCTKKSNISLNEKNNSEQNTINQSNNLPVYPWSKKLLNYSIFENIIPQSDNFQEVHYYTVEWATPTEITNWYGSKFSGYKIENNTSLNIALPWKKIVSLKFKKWNTLIWIIACSEWNQTIYVLWKKTIKWEALINKDKVNWEEPIQRYPNSFMLSYSKEWTFPTYYKIDYWTNDNYEKVSKWFKEKIKSIWWILKKKDNTSFDTIELEFKKDDDYITIYISKPTDYRSYTLISLNYRQYKIPDNDLKKWKDPIQRYPNSIMIDYEKSTMQIWWINTIEIKAGYISKDSFDKVKQWYIKKFNSMFWNSNNLLWWVYDNWESIDAWWKYNNKTIQVHVDFEKGKKYTKIYLDYTQTNLK